MATEHDFDDRKFLGLYMGTVLDNKDPEKIGRIRAVIPGLIDDGSAWAFPLGWPGAGSGKGMYSPPEIGADVGIFFHQGDIDHPHYFCGHPGKSEVPSEVANVETSVEDATKIFVHETNRWRFTLDERRGFEQLQLLDKKTGDVVEIDGVGLGIRIKATSALVLECEGALDIKALVVRVNGRTIVDNGKVI